MSRRESVVSKAWIADVNCCATQEHLSHKQLAGSAAPHGRLSPAADVNSVLMSAIPLILMAGLGSLVFYLLYASERYRADAIRALATRSGMHYLGDAVPRSLTLEGTPFSRSSKIWNLIDGEPRGTRIIAFDCQVGAGKRSWRRSVIAVESDGDVFRNMPLHAKMAFDRSGRWKIIYRPKANFNLRGRGLTSVEELEANLIALVTGSAKTNV